MNRFEYFFMDKQHYEKNGVDKSMFKKLEDIEEIQVVTSRYFTYIEEDFKPFQSVESPFKINEIEVFNGCVMIVGYYK